MSSSEKDVVDLGFSLTQLLGMPELEALDLLKENKKLARVSAREGSQMTSTGSPHTGRVNLVIMNGVVASYYLG